MTVSSRTLFIIILSGLVTVVSRVLPFIFVKRMTIPKKVEQWLSYIPICILAAFLVQSLVIVDNQTFSLNVEQLIVVLPTFVVAIWTKNLAKTVVFGMVLMAIVRFFL